MKKKIVETKTRESPIVKNMKNQRPQRVLKLAIPKKGRLREPALQLVKRAGYNFTVRGDELSIVCKNSNLELIFLQTQDIPILVEKGVVDLGITGKDNVEEKRSHLTEILPLNYGECRLCLASVEAKTFSGLANLRKRSKLRIATSFPNLTRDFCKQNRIKAEIIVLSGSIEVMIALGVSDYVVDLVQSGTTLRANHLKEVYEIGSYYTALYSKTILKNDPEVVRLTKRLKGILIADRYSILEFNIEKKFLQEAEKIAPGFDAPTISHLDDPHKVAVKVLTEKKLVNVTMEKLSQLGATGIFETEITNCRP